MNEQTEGADQHNCTDDCEAHERVLVFHFIHLVGGLLLIRATMPGRGMVAMVVGSGRKPSASQQRF
jgi:hypothetical protein